MDIYYTAKQVHPPAKCFHTSPADFFHTFITHQLNVERDFIDGRDSFLVADFQRSPDLLLILLDLILRKNQGYQVDHVECRLLSIQIFACCRNNDWVESGCGTKQGSRWSSVVFCNQMKCCILIIYIMMKIKF